MIGCLLCLLILHLGDVTWAQNHYLNARFRSQNLPVHSDSTLISSSRLHINPNPNTTTTTNYNNPLIIFAVPATNITETLFECLDVRINCANHGICVTNGTFGYACKCDHGYVSHDCDSGVQCCYTQLPRVQIFLLAFFVGWTGAPYFVMGETGLGVGILLMFFLGFILLCLGQCNDDDGNEGDKIHGCCSLMGMLIFLGGVLWNLATWGMIAASTEPWNDRNGVPIAGWN